MIGATMHLGLRPSALPSRSIQLLFSNSNASRPAASCILRRQLSSRALTPRRHPTQLSASSSSRLPVSICLQSYQLRNTPSTPSSFFTPSLCRHASTTTSADAATATNPSTSATASPPQSTSKLDWNTFFKLRASRRRMSLVFSVVSSILTTFACGIAISTSPAVADFISKTVPTDPFVSMGIATFAATLLGWLIGPFFGNAIWRTLHRSRIVDFVTKERAFYERIKRHRVDPRGASANNPVPDYYGEKIGSVQGYRRWLKDQRAFNRKRGGTFVS